MTDDAAKELAELIKYYKDRVGSPNRSARPGDAVRVTLGGTSGIIDAAAGTVIKGGEVVAVVNTLNGPVAIQGQSGGSLGVDVVISEIWEEEDGRDKPQRPKQVIFINTFMSGVDGGN